MVDESTIPRCVFDCVVLLQAAVSRGPAFALLALVESQRLTLLISNDVILELQDVLLRPAVYKTFPILTGDFVEAFIDRLKKMATTIDPVPARFRFPRDPDDVPYLNLAIHGAADYLVTRDLDLLDLAEPGTDESGELQRICPNLRIADPVTLLRELVEGSA
jgi:putative PIN family toxin of toxin-antitoxin system